MNARIAIALLTKRQVLGPLLALLLLVVLMPVIVAAGTIGVFAEEAERGCLGASINETETPAGGGPLARGLYAAPLELKPGRWYEVGATEYGGPGDPTSGENGSIPNPGESYLPSHPDSFAELSVMHTNPANSGTFTFTDANALANLPYLTQLRVAHAGHQAILAKRDIGYGQGPGQFIANGQPYRLDVWWQAARTLQITKSSVKVQLAPKTGAAGTLDALPIPNEPSAASPESPSGCTSTEGTDALLALSPGTQTKILPSGLASAGEDVPPAVKAMVAAGNRLFRSGYLYGGAHGVSLDTLQPAYDCSSAVSYLLHAAGKLGTSALDSSGLEDYGEPGPGRYVSIYANAAHAFIYVAGLRFDTVEAPSYDSGPNAGKAGPRWRVSPSIPDWATWIVRHPAGL